MKKKNNIFNNIKRTWVDFKDWFSYVKDQKKYMEKAEEKEDTIDCLKKQIEDLKYYIEGYKQVKIEQDELIAKLDARIQILNQKYSDLKKVEKEKNKKIEELQIFISQLGNDLEQTEYRRRVNAVEIGHRQRKINKLEKEKEELQHEIEKKDHKINFLQSSKHAPTKEEIIAYETQMKAVEKKYKATSVTMKNDVPSIITK